MGKNWKGGRGGGGRGGGGKGSNDLTSCRGHGFVMGTCDAAREREASKELVNLLTQAIEEMDSQNSDHDKQKENGIENTTASIEQMLADEISEIRNQSHKDSQNVISINTNVKGMVLVKIMRDDVCPVRLVKSIFRRVKTERQPVSRQVVRLIPLQYSFFPNPDELKKNIQDLIFDKFGYKPLEIQIASTAVSETHTDAHLKRSLEDSSASEDVSLVEDDPAIHQDKRLREDETVVAGSTAASLPVADMTVTAEQQTVEKQQSCEKVASVDWEPPVEHAGSADEAKDSEARGDGEASAPKSYSVSFKARNHDTLTRALATSTIQGSLPKTSKYLKYNSEGLFMVEALRNLGGIAYVTGYEKLEEFNLRKYQAKFAEPAAGSTKGSGASKGKQNSMGGKQAGGASSSSSCDPEPAPTDATAAATAAAAGGGSSKQVGNEDEDVASDEDDDEDDDDDDDDKDDGGGDEQSGDDMGNSEVRQSPAKAPTQEQVEPADEGTAGDLAIATAATAAAAAGTQPMALVVEDEC